MKNFRRFILSSILTTLVVQFAGCGAADIQSAKLYRQRRDYIHADQLLQKALAEDPTSDEGWYLYTANLYDLKEYEKISNIIDTAMLYSTTHRQELQSLKHNTWVELYNGGYSTYNANPDSKDAQQSAIGYLESARKLEPEQPETYELLGAVYYAMSDTAKGLANYLSEINQVAAAYDQGVAMGLMLHMSPEAVQRAIGGAPARQQAVALGASDSALVYVYPSKQAYIYFERAKPHDPWQLSGWRIGADETAGMQPLAVSVQAYELVANDYYQKGLTDLRNGDKTSASTQFDKAIPLLMTLQQIDPSNDFAAEAIPDIYTRLDRTDKAKTEYERILAEHPSTQMYVSYGTLLLKSQDYTGAIGAYQKALAITPSYEAALYDLAAVYKNQAASEQKANPKDPKYKDDLMKSTDYFEQLHAINKNDPSVLENLAENYDILGQKDKATGLIGEFEALKSTDASNTPEYWEMLGKLYARANRPADSQAAYKKADEMKQGK
ncbi:MAG TPA: tetratricopeptide repeat protein [Candidatus Kapabacteria bacterium]|jgi:tetratricopeptide (TPR) repeat protein|nr:tetratricopeptide repeat protein [Candidatus Kapabacteria bacterium]